MNYVGVDIHKRYSVLVAVDERGRELGRSRSNGNTAFGFAQFFGGLEGKSKVVLEACWNWGRIYDLLSEIGQVEEVVLAHPLKTRLIADAQIKTDGLDAHALATLLRGDLIARAHVPAKPTRQRKEVLRQRLYWARLRTRIRNRIHALIDRQRELKMPQCSDLFGRKGLSALNKLVLSEPDATLLREELGLLELIQGQIKAQEARIVEFNSNDEMTLRLQSIPGMGKILAAVAAAEIDSIERFSSAAKLCAYAGVSSADPCQRWKSLPGSFAQEPQQMVAVGVYRGGLGGGWLFGLLRRSLSPASRSRQERQYCHHHHRPADVSDLLDSTQRKERFY